MNAAAFIWPFIVGGLVLSVPASAQVSFSPITLQLGENIVSNIDGNGSNGAVHVFWRGNGNAWGYNLFVVTIENEIVGRLDEDLNDTFRDTPHMGEDMVGSVRFAFAEFEGRRTLHALVAQRHFVNSVPEAASTSIDVYALTETDGSWGTLFQFAKRYELKPQRLYCNADMALKTELNLSLPADYSGAPAPDGCSEYNRAD